MVDTRVHKIGHQFGKFIVAGLLSTAINYGVFYILFKLGVSYMVAMAIGFLAGAGFGFHLNRVWTYETDTISTGLMARYLAVYLGPVEIHRVRMIVAPMWIMASKLISVLHARIAIRLNSLSF